MAENDHAPDDDVPPYLDIADICRVSARSPRVVREHLKGLGIGEKLGNKLVASSLDLREKWPSLYRQLVAKAAEGKLTRPARPAPPRRKAS
jgi:hypothetical protein